MIRVLSLLLINLLAKINSAAAAFDHLVDGCYVVVELLFEGGCLFVEDDVVVYLVFDDDETEEGVVDHGRLHLVKLFRHLALCVRLSSQEEMFGY